MFICAAIRLHTGTSIFPLQKLSQILIFPPAVSSVTELRKIKILVLRSCLNKVSLLAVRSLKANLLLTANSFLPYYCKHLWASFGIVLNFLTQSVFLEHSDQLSPKPYKIPIV